MTKKILQLVVVLLIAAQGVMAQTVQVVSLTNAAPGDIQVQVDMDNYTDVSAITLYIEYDSDLLNFTGITNTTLTGTWVANYNAAIDKVIVTYTAGAGYTNTPSGKLFDLQFYNNGGFSSDITFDEPNCEIVEYLTVIPTVFTNGSVTQSAAVGTVSMTGLTVPFGSTAIMPVTMFGTGFAAVDAITLEIAYDETQLVYVGIAANPYLTGVVASAGSGVLTLNWTGAAEDFTTATDIFDIQFVYYGGNADVEFIPGCEIASAGAGLATGYVDGSVTQTPGVGTVSMTDLTEPIGNTVDMPVTMFGAGFTSVDAITLEIAYDETQLVYVGIAPNPYLTGVVASAGSGVLTLNWTGAAEDFTTATDIFDIQFVYYGGNADVEFIPGCEIASGGTVLTTDYTDGTVTAAAATATLTIDAAGAIPGDAVTVPIIASGFTGVQAGAVTLAVSFDNSILTYTGYTTQQLTGWVVSANGSGEISLVCTNGAGTAITDANLVTLNFNYAASGGLATIEFDPGSILTSTNLVTIPTTFVDGSVSGNTVSGVLKYANTTGADRPITNSSVYLMSSDGITTIATTTTDASGNYQFEGVADGNYLLDASSSKTWGGLTLADYAIVRAFVNNGVPVLSGIKWTAADVNTSNTVTLADYAIIRNRVNTSSTAGWSAPNWIFEETSISVSADVTGTEVIGICSGDVNTSYTPPL